MTLSGRPLHSITEEDLDALISDRRAEGKTIDYKLTLPRSNRDGKKEFLADVSSFANASGGDIVFGIQENAGLPTALPGVESADPDADILRLESTLRDGIDPRIPSVASRWVLLSNGKFAIVVRIPRSWAAPHVVDFDGHWRFYSRASNGKYQLDVREVRSAFIASESAAAYLRDFQSERLARIVAGETPIELTDGPRVVVHIVPLSAADTVSQFDVINLSNDYSIAPIHYPGSRRRINFDGLLVFHHVTGDARTDSYLQVFRNGDIEAVNSELLSIPDGVPGFPAGAIPMVGVESKLIDAVERFRAVQRGLEVPLPVFVMVSLLGVRGRPLVSSRFSTSAQTIDRDTLIIPEVMVNDDAMSIETVMKPIFDTTWNAAGEPGSPSYGPDDRRRSIEPWP